MTDDEAAFIPERWIVIPSAQLSAAALEGILQEYISREGTDYGSVEVPLEQQLQRARSALDDGECVIVFDRQLESCQLLGQQQLSDLLAGRISAGSD